MKSRFPTDFVERRQVEHLQKPEGWVIGSEDLHALDDIETEWLQRIMATVMEARGEITRDSGMEDAALKVIDVEAVEVIEGDTLAELEAMEGVEV